MFVTLLASTALTREPVPSHLRAHFVEAEEQPFVIEEYLPVHERDMNEVNRSYRGAIKSYTHDLTDADRLAEFAGRLCYLSWRRANEATQRNEDYVQSIIAKQHFSVLEHASATFLIQGVSRALTHELVRHRHFSYSQLSQRYVDHSVSEAIVPPVVYEYGAATSDESLEQLLAELHKRSIEVYSVIYEKLTASGVDRKAARGAARAALLEATETQIVVTGNHRSWREFIQKRASAQADAEIHQLADDLLWQLKEIAPATYADLS